MTHTATFEYSQMSAFIVTVFAFLGSVIYAIKIANNEGMLRPRRLAKVTGIFGLILFSTWAAEGYLNGDAFVESGLRPFGLVLRFLPFLLKAL
jgi:hypothetical protein